MRVLLTILPAIIIAISAPNLRIEQFLQIESPSQLSVSIVDKDDVVFYSAPSNYSRINSKLSLFQLNQLSNLFVVVSILQLVESKRIKLNQSVNDFIALKCNTNIHKKSCSSNATILHLITHSSGLEYKPVSFFYNILQYSITFPDIIHEPGTIFSNENYGYQVLASIVESITRISFKNYVTEKILIPLEMTDTTILDANYTTNPVFNKFNNIFNASKPNPHLISLYKNGANIPWKFTSLSNSLGVVSTMNDMTKFISTILNKGMSMHNLHKFGTSPSRILEVTLLNSRLLLLN